MRTLYLECSSGISGDMTIATLLDLGADKERLKEMVDGMNIGCKLHFGHTEKNGIYAYDFDVECLDEKYEQERGLKEINEIINNSDLPLSVKFKAKEMFEIVAKAEAKVHGLPIDEVHFHEVGAVDSIVDICAAAFCIYDLHIDKVVTSPLSEGTGHIKCRHGIIPVPAPATLEICRSKGVPLNIIDVQGEMVTPTGAAIAAAFSEGHEKPKNMNLVKVGYGAGKKDFPHANILRGFIYEEAETALSGDGVPVNPENRDTIVVLETNIDDSTGEELGFALEKLFEVGVKDAWFTPIYMKKCRPAYALTVMCKPEQEKAAVEIILSETSAVGMRRSEKERIIMSREKAEVQTAYGPVKANRFSYGDIEKISLEYDSAKSLAEEKGVSINKIYRNYKV